MKAHVILFGRHRATVVLAAAQMDRAATKAAHALGLESGAHLAVQGKQHWKGYEVVRGRMVRPLGRVHPKRLFGMAHSAPHTESGQ